MAQIRPIRKRHGFRLMLAVYLPEPTNRSAWFYTGQIDDLERRYYGAPDRRRLADAALAWAATQARERGEEVDPIIAAHPGFTTATHVTEGTLIAPTPTQPEI